MSRFSASVATTGFALLLFAVASAAQTQTQTQTQDQTQDQIQDQAPAQTHVSLSKVRIVRLSEIRGEVQLDRSIGHGYEPAMVNMPVVEQNSLKTAMGVAEVEFEDNSTLRVGPDSEAQFLLLGRTGQGNTVSSVRLVSGTAYVSLVKTTGKQPANVFDLSFGDQRNIHLQPDTHVRLEMDGQRAKLAVLSGTVHVDGPNGGMDVAHKNTMTFALAGNTQPEVAKSVAAESLDTWDKQLDQYHSRVASYSNYGGVPYAYGLSDMSYYGSFANTGCGEMWRPYFASAAWNPYSNGTWAYYGGAGYSWVSPYPWGWTAYHSGSWSSCPGTGWGWTPDGSWQGLNNVASGNGVTITGGRRLPIAPAHPPRFGESSLVAVSQTSLVHSGLESSGSFVFRKDSAGLGIPRNELGNLKGFSEHAVQRGSATTPVYLSTAPGASNGARGTSNAPAPVVIQRGYAPSFAGFSSERSSNSLGSAASVGNRASGPMPMSSASSMSSAHASGASGGSGGGGHH